MVARLGFRLNFEQNKKRQALRLVSFYLSGGWVLDSDEACYSNHLITLSHRIGSTFLASTNSLSMKGC